MPSLAGLISLLLRAFEFLVLLRVLLSWLSVSSTGLHLDHPAMRLLCRITDPLLEPLRRLVPPIGGTVDVSPVILLILLEVLRRVVVGLLIDL